MQQRFILIVFLLLCWSFVFSQEEAENKAFHELDFKLTNQYRNNTLEPTWAIYSRDFTRCPQQSALLRFETISLEENSNVRFSQNKNGLLFQDQQSSIAKVFPKIKAPCVLAKLEVSTYSDSHIAKIGFAKDEKNYVMLSSVNNAEKSTFVLELKNEGSETITKSFAGFELNDQAYTLYFFLGNNHFRFLIEAADGLQHIGHIENKSTDFTKLDKLQDYSPAFGIHLNENEFASFGKFSAGYFEGIGHADIRSVTYENGEPIRNENGNFYISTSSRFMGKNGGSGGICIYEMDSNGRIVRPVSLIAATKQNQIEAGTAAKLVFDRETKQWIYIARAFPSPGGMLHIGITSENLLNDGLHLVECETQPGIVGNSLDGDLIKIDDFWYIAYHGGHPRKLHIAKSDDLKNWLKISATKTGEGISIAKKNNEYFIIDATSPTQMDVRKMFAPSEIVGTIELSPSPGNHCEHGGYPWGCIIPVINGNTTKYLMVCFSMDEYMENTSGGIFTYGDIFSYQSESQQLIGNE